MKKYCLLILYLLVIVAEVFSQSATTATGLVYHDLNGNGRKDRREPGIAGVAVSNGELVVLTNEEGRYTIPVSNDAIISVIKPGNFQYPVNDRNLPQFFYIHKTEGSPELEYPGVAPTGPLPASVDFGLLTGSESDTFSIAVFSDPQPYAIEEIDYYDRSIVRELVGDKSLAFGISLGDLTGDRPDFFETLNKATSRIGVPWFHVIGNHDINFDAKNPMHKDDAFERTYGPANFAFNQGKVHFIVLDNILYPNEYDSRTYVGGFREDQFRFIENTLKHVPKDYLVVINVHIPFFNEFPHGETFLDAHRERLFDVLKDHPHTFSMSGHTHTQRHHFFGSDDFWQQENPHHHYNVATASGDWWSGKKDENGIPDAVMRDGTPKGYNLIHFEGNKYVIDFKAAGYDENYRMRLYGPKVVPHNFRFRGEFFVNFFQGSEKCDVQYRINNEDWKPMNYTIEQDPFISGIRYQWDTAEKMPEGIRPSNPTLSYHLWKIRIPTRLPLGKNVIEVKAIDMYGRTFTDKFEFQVVPVNN
jgi:hypothetical protein